VYCGTLSTGSRCKRFEYAVVHVVHGTNWLGTTVW